MISPRVLFGSLILAAAAALAACNNNPGYVYYAPTPGPTCSPGEAVQMVYPIPGATAVPDNPQQIVFAVPSPLPTAWNVVLNNSATLNGHQSSTIAGFQTITAAQVPSPAATPAAGNSVYQSVTLASGFLTAQTIYIWVNNRNSNCTPDGPVGSFTTQ